MKILFGILGVLLLFFCVLLFRAVLCKSKGRKLNKKGKCASEEVQEYYCNRLAKMIQCQTVSKKEEFEASEFLRLREVIRLLFPNVSERAEVRYFDGDCYVYKLSNISSDSNVMLMSHHDVVSAEGEWKYPPFSGTMEDGKIWGRGTVDTKTPLFAEFSALEELLAEGWNPPCNIYLVSSHNEEIAGDGVPAVLRWLEEEHITFDWILDEGGAVIDPSMSGIQCKCAMLAVHEKGRFKVRIKARQEAGHGSLSKQTKSPEVRMAGFITEVEQKKPFLRKMHPELLAMFEGLAPYMNLPMRLVFANMWCFKGLLKHVIPALNAQAGSMLGTTCTFKNLQTTESGDCVAEAYFRCVKEEDLEEDFKAFRKIAQDYQIEMEDVLENEYHRPARLGSPGYRFIKSCVERQFDYAACVPFILPAGTDARHLCDLSDAVIRFAPIDINNQQYGSVHNVNENIDMDSVVRAVKFYKEVLRRIS